MKKTDREMFVESITVQAKDCTEMVLVPKRLVARLSSDKLLAACRYWEAKKLALDAVRPDFTNDQLRELNAAEGRLLAAIHELSEQGATESASKGTDGI